MKCLAQVLFLGNVGNLGRKTKIKDGNYTQTRVHTHTLH